jgi:hypothetical protein
MQDYDRTSKWLIQHHGDSILRIAGVRDLVSWRPLQAELVQPRQLPDGLIEARHAGQAEPRLYVLEPATYPDERLLEQVLLGHDARVPRSPRPPGSAHRDLAPQVQPSASGFARAAKPARLEARFRAVPPETVADLQIIEDDDKLDDLVRLSVSCPNLAAFRVGMIAIANR